MKIISSFFILFLALYFTGCADKTSALNHFENDKLSAKAIQYTKKRDLLNNNEVEALIFVTYLNNVDEKYESDNIETFILGVQIANKDNENFFKDSYKLVLNEKESVSLKGLDSNSTLVNSIPLKNPWARYYLVKFNNKEELRELNLEFIHTKYGTASLSFQK
ncbi:hypothetical protein [Halarcobacter sp.]|uniref:hypothetical protein n=1 Tax=Halarcobacter TaxID=2321115 RepID=UPI003A94802E